MNELGKCVPLLVVFPTERHRQLTFGVETQINKWINNNINDLNVSSRVNIQINVSNCLIFSGKQK